MTHLVALPVLLQQITATHLSLHSAPNIDLPGFNLILYDSAVG